MNYKFLGDTTVSLPEIGVGTFNYKGGVEPLRTAIALGAGLIDTAEYYGTEEIVGEAIKGNRDRVFLADKVSPAHFRRPALLLAAERSLQRLRTDYIDLYQLHRPNYTVPIQETMAAMEELVEQGKIRFIGVSNFSVAELKTTRAARGRATPSGPSCSPKDRLSAGFSPLMPNPTCLIEEYPISTSTWT